MLKPKGGQVSESVAAQAEAIAKQDQAEKGLIDLSQPKVEGVVAAFRHKQIRRFKVGKFEFKNYVLEIRSEKDFEEFAALIDELRLKSPRDIQGIVQIDAEAAARAEKPLSSGVVRNAFQSSDIKTKKDADQVD